jgi:hypothetical protein
MLEIVIWQDGEFNGVNARKDGKWLAHDDAFTTLMKACLYAEKLKRDLSADRITYAWAPEREYKPMFD